MSAACTLPIYLFGFFSLQIANDNNHGRARGKERDIFVKERDNACNLRQGTAIIDRGRMEKA